MNARSETGFHVGLYAEGFGLEFGGIVRRNKTATIRQHPRHAGLSAPAVTVRDIIVPAPVRLAQAVASAAIVRDVAAFGALIVFGTMLAVLCGYEPMV